jgi:hypothetical protein
MAHFDDTMDRAKRRSLLLMLRGRAFLQSFKTSLGRSRSMLASIAVITLLSGAMMNAMIDRSTHLDSDFRQRGLQNQDKPTQPKRDGHIVHLPPSGAQARHCIRDMGAIHDCVNHRHSNCTAARYWQCLRQQGFADGQYTALVRRFSSPSRLSF